MYEYSSRREPPYTGTLTLRMTTLLQVKRWGFSSSPKLKLLSPKPQRSIVIRIPEFISTNNLGASLINTNNTFSTILLNQRRRINLLHLVQQET
jgi:hypothetical protein